MTHQWIKLDVENPEHRQAALKTVIVSPTVPALDFFDKLPDSFVVCSNCLKAMSTQMVANCEKLSCEELMVEQVMNS
jgi:hypothetical protein